MARGMWSLTERTEFADRMNGDYRVPPAMDSQIVSFAEAPALEPGSTVHIRVSEDGALAATCDMGAEQRTITVNYGWTRDGALIRAIRPNDGGPVILFLGPAVTRAKETVRRTPSGLSIRSEETESGLLLFLIPWQDPPIVAQSDLMRINAATEGAG